MTVLARRDVAVRYKQSLLGIGWALVRPLLTTLAFVAVFSVFVKVPVSSLPYATVVLAGLLPWQLFASTVSGASESLLGNAGILSKVYFPRVLFPLSSSAAPLVDFLVGLGLLAALMLWYGIPLTWRIAFLPMLVGLTLALSLGAGIFLSAATVRYRDLRYLIPFALQVGIYLSPVAYNTGLVPERWQLIYALNPTVGLIDGLRWALLGHPQLNVLALGISLAFATIALIGGLAYFRRVDHGLVDIL